MRKLTTKLLFAIISAAFALVALGTTTFAWFTLSDTATVSQFNAQVTAGDGIEISLDGNTYYTTIPDDVIQTAINKLNVTLEDITSPNGIDMYRLGELTAITYNAAPGEGETNPYIEFDLWVRSPSNATVNLHAVTFASTGVEWTPDATFTNAKEVPVTANDEPSTYYAHDALRLSIAEKLEEEEEEVKVVYEHPETETNTVLGTSRSPNGMVDYYLKKNGENLITSYSEVTLPGSTDLSAAAELLDLVENTPKIITVRIWIEGWDPDCFNSILDDEITAIIVFKKAE